MAWSKCHNLPHPPKEGSLCWNFSRWERPLSLNHDTWQNIPMWHPQLAQCRPRPEYDISTAHCNLLVMLPCHYCKGNMHMSCAGIWPCRWAYTVTKNNIAKLNVNLYFVRLWCTFNRNEIITFWAPFISKQCLNLQTPCSTRHPNKHILGLHRKK